MSGTPCRFKGRGCGRPVLFVALPSGSRMPVDTAACDDGNVAVHRDVRGVWCGRVLKAGEQADPWERRHMTHFATCTAYAADQAGQAAEKAARAAGVTVLADRRGQRRGR